MAIAFVHQGVGTWSSGTSFNVTITAPTNGNLLILEFGTILSTTHITSITQTNVSNWTKADASATNRDVEVWYAENVSSAGTTVTVNLNQSATGTTGANVSEYSGMATSSSLDGHQINNGNNGTPTTASLTPTQGREMLLVAVSRLGGAYATGPSTGSASFVRLTAPDVRTEASYAIVNPTSGSYTTSWTAGSGTWDNVIASFFGAGVPAGLITTQPSNVVSGVANSPAIVWKATTDGTTIDTTFTGNVTVSVNTGSGSISGTTVVAAVAGVATFSNVIITGSGAHTLHFVASGYANVNSNSFTVTGLSLAMAVDAPSTATSGLGLYNMSSGAHVTISGGAGAGSFDATQAGKVCLGTYINGNLSGSGVNNYQITVFNGTTGVTLVGTDGVTAAPDCSNKSFTVGTCIVVQASDGAAGVAVTATLASGTGTLGGTTVVNTDANGFAHFGALLITLAAGSVAHTITFSATSYTSVTSASCTVSAVYVTTADYVYGCYQEPTLGLVIAFALFVRNGAVVGTPERLLTYCGSSNTQGYDNVQNLSDAVTSDITSNKTTFPYTSFMPQVPPGGNEVITKVPWRLAMPAMHSMVINAGYNIDTGYLFYMGYSMGAIQAPDLAYLYPTYWCAMMILDSGWFASHIANASSGVMPAYFDTNTSAALEFVRKVGDSVPIYNNQSDDSVAPFDTKTMNVLWVAYQASGYDVFRYANSITGPVVQNVQPGQRRPYIQWNGYNHGALDGPASSRTTDATMWNWMLSVKRQGGTWQGIPHGHEFSKAGRRWF